MKYVNTQINTSVWYMDHLINPDWCAMTEDGAQEPELEKKPRKGNRGQKAHLLCNSGSSFVKQA